MNPVFVLHKKQICDAVHDTRSDAALQNVDMQ